MSRRTWTLLALGACTPSTATVLDPPAEAVVDASAGLVDAAALVCLDAIPPMEVGFDGRTLACSDDPPPDPECPAGSDERGWFVNGHEKSHKLGLLLCTREDVTAKIYRASGYHACNPAQPDPGCCPVGEGCTEIGWCGAEAVSVEDVFCNATNLNELLGPGSYVLEFYGPDGWIEITDPVQVFLDLA